MFSLAFAVLQCLAATLQTRRHLVFEDLALRHQGLVLNRTVKSPALRVSDRLLWATLSTMWSRWTKVDWGTQVRQAAQTFQLLPYFVAE